MYTAAGFDTLITVKKSFIGNNMIIFYFLIGSLIIILQRML